MSAYKWTRLYQCAIMHHIVPYVYDGIERCRSQFFVHLTEKQEKYWKQSLHEEMALAEQRLDELDEV